MSSKKAGQWLHVWGYRFQWTPDHLTEEDLRPLTLSYDTLASECLEHLDRFRGHSRVPPATVETPSTKGSHPDLSELLRCHAAEDKILGKLWQDVNAVPEWVDWQQIERGQKVFYRYAGPAIVALTFQSLLGGMGSRRVVETLGRTGGFGVNVARRRLLETFQHILEVTRDVRSVAPGGKGFASSIRVRFLHASVCRRIMQLAEQKPGYYDVDEYGVPVNDLDSIATIISFSAALIWVGLPRQGIFLRPQEAADYIALWRWVGHVVGAPTAPFATPVRAKAFMESIMVAEIRPSGTSQVLANNIIAGLHGQPPTYLSRPFLQAEARWLNGPALADALAIPQPASYYTALVAGQCLFFAAICYLRRSVPSMDEAATRRLRDRLHRLAADQTGAEDAAHEFKYVPALGLMTAAESDVEMLPLAARGRKAGVSVEQRNLGMLLLVTVVFGLLVWLGVRIVGGFLHGFRVL